MPSDCALRSFVVAGAAALAVACSTAPEIDGRKANECTTEEIAKAAQTSFEAKDWPRAADLAEFLLKNRFKSDQVETARWIAAESRFENQELPEAFIHYQRLMDENPFHRQAPLVVKRVWTIGKTLVEEDAKVFTDFSARHDVGIEALNFLVTRFPRSDLADDAWKELAEAFAADASWQSAADSYERLARDYADSEWVDLALYKVAGAYRAQSRGGDYDVDPLLRSHAALDRYLSRLPDGNFVKSAKDDRAALEREIGQRELEIAEFYRARGNEDGRLTHIANAAARFPDTPEAETARALLAELGATADVNAADLLKPRADRPPWRRGPATGATPGSESPADAPGAKPAKH